MQNLEILYSLIPALGAILLSLYNWWVLRQGGKIKPLKIVNYGLWSVKSNEKNLKHLFIPVILDNVAIKPALVLINLGLIILPKLFLFTLFL